MKTIKLFAVFFKIAALTLGGGYAILPVIENDFVYTYKLFTKADILEIISLVQGMPGPLAVNCATLIGYRLQGLKGALASMLANVLPSLIIISLISQFFINLAEEEVVVAFFWGIRPAVVALILYFGLNMMKSIQWNNIKRFLQVVFLLLFIILGINPIILIVFGILSGLVYSYWLVRKEAS